MKKLIIIGIFIIAAIAVKGQKATGITKGYAANMIHDTIVNFRPVVTYFIAASDATSKEKKIADAVCDGTADQVQINAALIAGYKVQLSTGIFMTSAAITAAVDNIVLEGTSNGTIITRSGSPPDFNVITIGGDNWTIQNLTIDGNSGSHAGSGVEYGISATAKDYLKIKNVTFTDIDWACIYLVTGCEFISIDHCLFVDNWYNCIQDAAGGINHVKITDCDFLRNDYCVIYLDDDALSSNWIIENCIFRDIGYRVKLYNVEYCKVNNCHFDSVGSGDPSGTNGSISFEDAVGCIISNTTIENSFGTGLELRGVTNQTVLNVNIYDSRDTPFTINTSQTPANSSYVNVIGGHIGTSSGVTYATIIDDNSTYINFNGTHFDGEDYALRFDADDSCCTVIGCHFNDNSARGVTTSYSSGSTNHLIVQNCTFTSCGIGIEAGDGDDMMFSGNKFVQCTTPIDISDAAVVRPFIDGNMWYGCTNDIDAIGATNPVYGDNIDKDGGIYAP